MQGIAIDRAAEMIYWGNTYSDTVHRAGLDGTGTTTLDRTGTSPGSIHGMAVDPPNGRVYWANPVADVISFTNMDGSGSGGDLVTAPAVPMDPNGVAIAPGDTKIYWTDTGSIVDTGAAPIINPFGIAIDPATNWLYWADVGSIAFARQDGTGDTLDTDGATSGSGPTYPAVGPRG